MLYIACIIDVAMVTKFLMLKSAYVFKMKTFFSSSDGTRCSIIFFPITITWACPGTVEVKKCLLKSAAVVILKLPTSPFWEPIIITRLYLNTLS